VVKFQHVNKWYGSLHVLREINLRIAKGEVVVVCGPSGSGKSTLIRCINRLEPIQAGEIFVDGKPLSDPTLDLRALRAEIGFVFQAFNFLQIAAHADFQIRGDTGLFEFLAQRTYFIEQFGHTR